MSAPEPPVTATPRPPRLTYVLLPIALAGLGIASLPGRAATEGADPTLAALTEGLDGTRAALKSANLELPYYQQLVVWELEGVSIQATSGVDAALDHRLGRSLDVDLRLGSMQLDNTHKIRDASWFSTPERPQFNAPLAAGPALVELVWRATDEVYRSARRQLTKVRANDSVKVKRDDLSDDFSLAPVVAYQAPPARLVVDEAAWQSTLRDVSALYLNYPTIYDSSALLNVERHERWLVNNEGSRVHDGRLRYRAATWAETVAEDGMRLSVYDYVDAATADHLPSREDFLSMARRVANTVLALRNAPVIEPHTGPAILRGRAAGVFFHEIFGHRIEGMRQKDEDEGQTFTDRVGELVLPAILSVHDDPTQARYGDTDLNGAYLVDDEGVSSEPVTLVERGILRNFLMSRAPVEGFSRSNGHGRRQPGNDVVARQGNLRVEAHQTVSEARLRELLIAEIKRQNKPFGLMFDDISGGFTFTGRSTPNAFSVQPVTVWRVYPDGRPDELVRGVDLIGTPLTTFSRILAASDQVDVFNGVCGAESGWVPVSAIAPSLLIGEVEVQRREKENDRPPLLPPPTLVPGPGGPV